MNIFYKTIAAGLFGLLVAVCGAFAQQPSPNDLAAQLPDSHAVTPNAQHCPHHGLPLDFQVNTTSYLPSEHAFVVLNATDNAIDLIQRQGDTLCRSGRYHVDTHLGRHDLNKILRPVSLQVVDNMILFVASSADSSYLGVLDLKPVRHDEPGAVDSLSLIAVRGFNCPAESFRISPCGSELFVKGITPSGYDIRILSLNDGFASIASAPEQSFHYHVPKQSERIQMSDPAGIGLTVVAVVVVFFALICIALILLGFGKAIISVQDKKANKSVAAAAKNGETIVSHKSADTAGEVYAAIAAAIYLYNEELHDDEDAVITIQKVERAWTPWNAKFYNMNQYFNIRRK